MCILAALLALVFVFVGSNAAANHEPKPHGLPLGVVGSPPAVAAIAGQLDRRAAAAFAVFGYRSPAAARTAILHRSVYGAFEPGPRPVLLVAEAASSLVAVAAILLTFGFRADLATRGALIFLISKLAFTGVTVVLTAIVLTRLARPGGERRVSLV